MSCVLLLCAIFSDFLLFGFLRMIDVEHRARASHLESQVKILESSKHRLEATVREMKAESSELRKSKSEKSFEVLTLHVVDVEVL